MTTSGPVPAAGRALNDVESFGGTAAEDDDIERFFVKTPTFTDIIEGKKHLVVGRKGAGKTALYLAVRNQARSEGKLSKGLTFAQYPWAAHYRYASPDVDTTERFVAPWTFLILIAAWSEICAAPPQYLNRQQSKAVGEVREFIENNYGTTTLNFKSVFPSGGLRLEALTVAPSATGVSGGSADFRRETQQLGGSLLRINEWMENKLRSVSDALADTFILFDELDLGFDASSQDHRDRTIGLLLAMRGFISGVTRSGVPIHPVVFIRSDIFNLLRFEGKNKIVNAEAIELEWHDDLRHSGASLKHLLDWRVKETLKIRHIDQAWNYAFDAQLARGTQHKFQHMTFRTFRRPRDVIQFANMALLAAQTRHRDRGVPDEDPRISNEDLKNARVPYSTYLLRELDDEIQTVDANWTQYVDVIREVGASKFSLADYRRAYDKRVKKEKINRSAEGCLEFLYLYSVIGFQKAVTGAGITQQFRYQDESVTFDIEAPWFHVHRGLKETLGITETL
ncbi:P-loop ATPase, Sll1717 family [Aquipuribacter sp. MA13-6]|uniref:P-loop ATPase, Sll1717 family n=1 Tax=unclassified Aquipuribacter TaxID=2635084 RepID=UPI003EEB2347